MVKEVWELGGPFKVFQGTPGFPGNQALKHCNPTVLLFKSVIMNCHQVFYDFVFYKKILLLKNMLTILYFFPLSHDRACLSFIHHYLSGS